MFYCQKNSRKLSKGVLLFPHLVLWWLDPLLLDHYPSRRIFYVKYTPRALFESTLLQKHICYMLQEQCGFQIWFWSWGIFDLQYFSRLLMVRDLMISDHMAEMTQMLTKASLSTRHKKIINECFKSNVWLPDVCEDNDKVLCHYCFIFSWHHWNALVKHSDSFNHCF